MSNTNDFDTPEEIDQAIDQDMDFGEFEDKQQNSLGSVWKSSPLVKFGLIAAAILVVIVLITLFGGKAENAPNSLVSSGDKDFKEAPGTKEVSPTMKEAMEEKNQQRIDEAQKQGGSAIPTPIEAPKTLLEVPDEQGASEDPLLRWKQMQEERAKAQREQQLMETQAQPQTDPQRDAKVQSLMSGMSAQMGDILGKDKKANLQHMVVFEESKLRSLSNDGTDASNFQNAQNQNQILEPTTPAKTLLPAGKIEYGQMMLEANSDIPGPVVAIIASGPFNGGKLLGSFTSQEEYLVIKFTTLVTKKGTSIPINAFAVDPQTSLTGVATDVDHRYFQRIILPAAAKFVEGLGEAYAQTTTSTSQSTTSTTTTTEDMDTKQEFGKGVSEAAKQVGEVLSEDGKNTKPLVRVAAGTPVGVLFMTSITDQTVLKARNGSGQNSQTNQNGQTEVQQTNQNTNTMTPYQQLQMGLQNQQFMQQGYFPGTQLQQNNQPTLQPDGTYSTQPTGQ